MRVFAKNVCSDKARHNFVWGWLRLLLGILQLSLAPLALIVLIRQGVDDKFTWILLGATTLVTCASRLLYKGKRNPRLLQNDDRERGF